MRCFRTYQEPHADYAADYWAQMSEVRNLQCETNRCGMLALFLQSMDGGRQWRVQDCHWLGITRLWCPTRMTRYESTYSRMSNYWVWDSYIIVSVCWWMEWTTVKIFYNKRRDSDRFEKDLTILCNTQNNRGLGIYPSVGTAVNKVIYV
jgi:hypothetical protein